MTAGEVTTQKPKRETVTEMLLDAGYCHRPGRFEGLHEVYSVATGEVMGNFGACDAMRFLRAIEAIPHHPSN